MKQLVGFFTRVLDFFRWDKVKINIGDTQY
jgi:hypothetical protein